MLSKIHLGWLLVFSLLIWSIALPLFQDGMFVDGILYATVARNLALGYGTFWDPYVSQTFMQHFHEQPPLVFWLQSFFFRLVPHSIYPERIYSFCFLLFSVWGIRKFWREISTHFSFWPAILFLSIPTIRWGVVNNVLENSMLFFDLMAVFFFYKAMKNKNGTWFLLAGILLTFLASFSKGIQSLFPLATPLIYTLAYGQKLSDRKTWVYTLFAFIGIAAIYGILLISNEMQESYRMYFEQRFVDFPKTKHANTDNRLKLLYHLGIELAIPILVACCILLFSRINNPLKEKFRLAIHENTRFFILIGLSASLPLIITFEQRGFYLNTSMPYYALALACISQSSLSIFQNKYLRYQKHGFALKTLLITSGLIGIMTTIYFAGKPKRDADKLHDIHLIARDVGAEGNVCTTHEWEDWSMRYYFARYHHVSVTGIYTDCPMIIVQHTDTLSVPSGYYKSDLSTKYYMVYKR